MNGESISATEVVAEASIWTDGDHRTCTRATVFGTVNDVAVRSSRKARLEGRTPALISVVDDHESCIPTSKGDELGRRGDPVGDIGGLNGVPETDHSGDGGPAVLTVPTISSSVTGTSAGVSVWSTRVRIAELIAG